MPPSQLKQLKVSLRENGVLGPQKSKKEKKRTSSRGADAEKKLAQHAALEGIRERLNPFETRAPARKSKFDVTSSRNPNGKATNGTGRPGVTKGLGEQRRRETLLTEIQRRNKIGGILDRRFGENDPSMTPEQRAAERYARESERRLRKSSIFNLEMDDDEIQLTHGGRSLELGDEEGGQDDFDEADLEGASDQESMDLDGDLPRKRRRLSGEDNAIAMMNDAGSENAPELPKTKKEVMDEVMAKSKLYRYERQQAKEDDDELRAELDKGLPEFFELLRQQKRAKEPVPSTNGISTSMMNPDRAALLQGKDRKTADAEYNERVRQLALDQRSKPSERTKTEEEMIEEEAARLKELEQARLKRMQGEAGGSDGDDSDHVEHPEDGNDDAEVFGLSQNLADFPAQKQLDVEEEDDFVIDEDLVASDPDADVSLSEDEEPDFEDMEDEEEDAFIDGLTLPGQRSSKAATPQAKDGSLSDHLAYTYSCPSTHEEFLEVTQSVEVEDLPVVVQRIRALYHPKLDPTNKPKLEKFSQVLIEHVAFLAVRGRHSGYLARYPTRERETYLVPFAVLESLLRHIHSLAKLFPLPVGLSFRKHLTEISETRPLSLDAGDLIILTGVMHVFPTSDQFHSVATPAMLTMARYLAQSSINSLGDLVIGIYCSTLALECQRLSRRYVPEVMLHILNTMLCLAPEELTDSAKVIAYRSPPSSLSLRVQRPTLLDHEPLDFWDIFSHAGEDEGLKGQLLYTSLKLLSEAARLWTDASAFIEIFDPACMVLDHLLSEPCTIAMSPELIKQTQSVFSTIQGLLAGAQAARKPLALHNHRPLAIKSAIPKFEEGFNPDRHYDPDRERAEMNKLKSEHKKERKGALRELRKDANFIARESLKEKKEKDAAYEKKYRRLVAEIQGEEGKEAKDYEKQKRKRQGKW